MIFVDTNYFLRFLLRDVESQHEKAKKLFEEGAEGKIKLITSVAVFFEIYWVLKSFYEKDHQEISKILNQILHMTFINFENKVLLQKSIQLFKESNFSLEDTYNMEYAKEKKVEVFETFDQKLRNYFIKGKTD